MHVCKSHLQSMKSKFHVDYHWSIIKYLLLINLLIQKITNNTMGQVCQGTPDCQFKSSIKKSNALDETAQLQRKPEEILETPFSRMTLEIIQTLKDVKYKPQQLKEICRHQVVKYANGIYYQGQFEDREMSGVARLLMPNGAYYQGDLLYNKLNGEGILINTQGQYYMGSFVNNKAEGIGFYKGEDFVYEGGFKDNLQSGFGKLTKANETFEGLFVKGKKKKGKLIKTYEEVTYQGEFQGNIENGYGRLSINNEIHEGIFKNGYLEGEGKVINHSGGFSIANFCSGKQLGMEKHIFQPILLNETVVHKQATSSTIFLE